MPSFYNLNFSSFSFQLRPIWWLLRGWRSQKDFWFNRNLWNLHIWTWFHNPGRWTLRHNSNSYSWTGSQVTKSHLSVSWNDPLRDQLLSISPWPHCSLGALHDGDQNNCTSNDQYIMAAVPGSLDDSTVYNAFIFSNCSVDAIRFWMHYLTR